MDEQSMSKIKDTMKLPFDTEAKIAEMLGLVKQVEE